MAKRAALVLTAAASALILLSSFSSRPQAEVGFALLAVGFPVGLMAIGAARGGRLRSIGIPLLALLTVLEAGLVGMLLFAGRVESGPWIAGLPLAAALQLGALFLVPLFIIVVGYALSFRDFGVSTEDLERLRQAASRSRGSE